MATVGAQKVIIPQRTCNRRTHLVHVVYALCYDWHNEVASIVQSMYTPEHAAALYAPSIPP